MATLRLPDGRRLGYDATGNGSALVSFHGTPGCRLNRPRQLAGFRVISFDRPGYGLSTAHPGRSVADVAAYVRALADHLGLQRFAVYGVSGGGQHALACAALLDDRVTACAAVSSGAPIAEDEIDGLVPANRDSLRGAGSGPSVFRRTLLRDPQAAATELGITPDQSALFVATMTEALRPGVQGWLDDDAAVNDRPWGFDPSQIRCPVRFWHGELDRVIPITAVRRLAAEIPTAEVTAVAGAGHQLDVTAAVSAYLTGRQRPSGSAPGPNQ